MPIRTRFFVLMLCVAPLVGAQNDPSSLPRWWPKYEYLAANGPKAGAGASVSATGGANVDVSNECGPQSETFITLNPTSPNILAAGSNEIFRNPMRGYFSADGGNTWGGVDLPLPAPTSTNGSAFGSDPSLAFDSRGYAFYSYIVVLTSAGNGINGTEMAVARSADGGATYPSATYFSFSSGADHFNDKPMMAVDANAGSPYRDSVYVAWDAASGGSANGGIRFARSADAARTFSVTRIDNPKGPGKAIAADPFVGPNGEVYAAWNDIAANTIAFNRSFDGGITWGRPSVVSAKSIAYDIALPAISSRRALIYPSCDADRSLGAHRGRLYCSWADLTSNGTTDIFVAFSDNRGTSWSKPVVATDQLSFPVDRFYQWLSVDPTTGVANISFYDTRNDTSGKRYMTDVYLAGSTNDATWTAPNVRVSTVSSNEHDCNGLYPCPAIDYGNQYGDYEGLVSFGGVSHPVWTDSRDQLTALPGCKTGLAMEEVFTAAIGAAGSSTPTQLNKTK